MSPLYTIHSFSTHDKALSTNTHFPAFNPSTSSSTQPYSFSLSYLFQFSENLIQPKISSETNYGQNRILNYVYAAVNENTPCGEQSIVSNIIDGIPLKEYVVMIGHIIGLKNIAFYLKIYNNLFYIFLSNKQILNSI